MKMLTKDELDTVGSEENPLNGLMLHAVLAQAMHAHQLREELAQVKEKLRLAEDVIGCLAKDQSHDPVLERLLAAYDAHKLCSHCKKAPAQHGNLCSECLSGMTDM